jgi:hypothetical protein
MGDSIAKKTIRLSSIIFAALLLAGAALYIFVFINYFRNDAALGGGEDIVLYCSRLLSSGYQIYHSNPSIDAPFCYPMYPPVHYYILAAAHRLFGDSLIVGRLVCFVFLFVTAAMIGMIASIRSGNKHAGPAAAGIFLFFNPILFWSAQNRVDITALMFAVAGALWYFKFEKTRFSYLFSAVFFALAVYTKQTMLACFAALVLSLLFSNAKRAVALAALWSVIAIAVFACFNSITDGGFYFQMFRMHQAPMLPDRAYTLLKMILSDGMFLVFTAIALLPMASRRRFGFETVFIVVSWVSAAAALSYYGSSVNYMFETCAAVSIGAGIVISGFNDNKESKAIILAIAIAAMSQSIFVNLRDIKNIVIFNPKQAEHVQDVKTAAAVLKSRYTSDSMILYDTMQPALELHWDVRMNYVKYSEVAKVDDDILLRMIGEKKWAAVVMSYDLEKAVDTYPVAFPKFSSDQLKAIDENYVVDSEFKRKQKSFTLFVPR